MNYVLENIWGRNLYSLLHFTDLNITVEIPKELFFPLLHNKTKQKK